MELKAGNMSVKTEVQHDILTQQTLRLVQALLGAISPNFRMVALASDANSWRLVFVLATESAEDRGEIGDIACEFEALQDSAIDYKIEVVVTDEPIPWPSQSVHVVFRRREK